MKNLLLLQIALLGFSYSTFSQVDTSFNIWMWTTGKHVLHDGNQLSNYGFTLGIGTPSIPGPVLRVKEGQKVELEVRNQSQGAPHTIHLHGLDVDQANDGVPITSWDIKHKETKNYNFVATHPGTYLYHCHVASVLHVQFGMYGSIIVEPRIKEAAPGFPYDRDFNLLFSEADKSWFDNKPKHSTGDSVHAQFYIPKYEPDYFFVNGQSQHLIDSLIMGVNEKVLLRLSNVGYYENQVRFPEGVTVTLMSSDGRPLPQKLTIDTLLISPGERYGVLLSPIGNTRGVIEIDYVDLFTGDVHQTEKVPFGFDPTLSFGQVSKNAEVQVFPNPSKDIIHINYPIYKTSLVKMISDNGSVFTLNAQGKEDSMEIDIRHLPVGIYILQLWQGDDLQITKNIVKSE